MSIKNATIIAGKNFQQLGHCIAARTNISTTEVKVEHFADGELGVKLLSSVRDKSVFIIMSTNPHGDNLMELNLLADTCKESEAKEVIAIVPYYGYCRQERKGNERTTTAAALVGKHLKASGVDRIVNLDLHTLGIQGIFSALSLRNSHIEGHSVLAPYIKNLNLENLMFASPDIGGTGRVRAMQKHFPESSYVIVDKVREKANVVGKMTLIGDVTGMDVVLVDDIMDTGGTICAAADLLMEKGAKSVRAVITHPLMSGKAYKNLEESALAELITTNSIPLQGKSKKITVVDIAPMLSDVITSIINGNSVSDFNRID